ncbi:CDGSH iron-sulfur domain-containing protein [Tabrizicola oligotrophica]|uniref:CDGSH iron-sulfur domain-containing protein n=1 Tax=Tabrizicola oligotrophica TaxID=2710650 RepID=A0A6M0QSH3_9RHOB|nr:CDGSH iron-sulfur domain-containing protein [Tabrizicola oligotrophica]NEY90405.1 CDGSH iron-sulfur domain-containing protein [Tabrizicola oligotrophica]
MTEVPKLAQRGPYKVQLEAGKTYFWCACGESKTQPFCDMSHKGSAFAPKRFTAEETRTAWLCGCKRTKSAPFCDGTHKTL